MKKYNVSKYELMAGKYLVKEDGFISNGVFAIKEDYILVRKSTKAEFITVKEIAEIENLALNPAVKTLKDLLMLDRKTHAFKVEIEDDNSKSYITMLIRDDYKICKYRPEFNKIMGISPEIEFYHDNTRWHQIQIVLNNEVIGVFMQSC